MLLKNRRGRIMLKKSMIRDNIHSKLALIKKKRRGLHLDSFSLSFINDSIYINELANKAIRHHDRKYNDLVGASILVTYLIMLVVPIIKNLVLDMIREKVKTGIVNLATSILTDIEVLKAKRKNETYASAAVKAISKKIKTFIAILEKEFKNNAKMIKKPIFNLLNKLKNSFNKVKSVA